MTEYAVLNAMTLASLDDRYVMHISGDIRPATARELPDGERACIDLMPGDETGAHAAIAADEERRAGRRGRRPKPVVGLVFAGPPPYGDGEWERDAEDAWARDTVAFGRKLLGDESIIVAATMHRDETRPHVHIAAVPIQDGRISWRERQRAFLRARGAPTKGPSYEHLQDAYWHDVGARYNLKRGAPTKADERKARREAPDRMKAAEAARERAERELAKARERLGEVTRSAVEHAYRAHEAAADALAYRAECERLAERARQVREELEAHHAERERVALEVGQLRAELDAARRGLESVVADQDQAEADAAAARAERKREEGRLRDVRAARAEIQELEQRRVELRRERSQLEKRLAELTREYDEVEEIARRGFGPRGAAARKVIGERDQALGRAKAAEAAAAAAERTQRAAKAERVRALEGRDREAARAQELQRAVDRHPAELRDVEERGFRSGVQATLEAVGRYAVTAGGRVAHILADVVHWIQHGARDDAIAMSHQARAERGREGAGR